MSSLLSNDFVEQFFRSTKKLVTNNQNIFIDRSKRVVFSTPFETGDVIKVVSEVFSEQKINPDNVNILFDAISFYTSNPNIQNYLPLKISFGGKPQLEFASSDISDLTDFRIVKNPPLLRADVRNHRYGELSTISIGNMFGSSLNAVCQFGDIIYFSLEDVDFVQTYNLVTKVTGELVDSQNILQFKNNSSHLVGLSSNDELFDILNDRLIYENLDPDTVITDFHIKNDVLVLNEDQLIQGERAVIKWININGINGYPMIRVLDVFDLYAISGYLQFDIVDIDTIVLVLAEFFMIIKLTKTNSLLITNQYNGNKVGVEIGTFSSGDDKSSIDITHFTRSGNFILIYKMEAINNSSYDQNGQVVPGAKFDGVIAKRIKWEAVSNPFLVRYLNQVAWIDSDLESINFYNLDSNELVNYVIENNVPTATSGTFVPNSLFDGVSLEGLSFNEFAIITGKQIGDVTFFNHFANERKTNLVHKVTYNYDERILPFNLDTRNALNFSLELPNSGTTPDLEIFNYVIDYRIRYSKQKSDPNPSKPLDESKDKTKSRKRSKVIRDTKDVLGLVDPGQFTLNDFLNLYQTN